MQPVRPACIEDEQFLLVQGRCKLQGPRSNAAKGNAADYDLPRFLRHEGARRGIVPPAGAVDNGKALGKVIGGNPVDNGFIGGRKTASARRCFAGTEE